METHLHRRCMTKTHIQRNGSHLHRNIDEDNPFKKKCYSFLQKCKQRQYTQKENGSHLYRNVNDDNPFKKKW